MRITFAIMNKTRVFVHNGKRCGGRRKIFPKRLTSVPAPIILYADGEARRRRPSIRSASSIGQSARLIIARFLVRPQGGAPSTILPIQDHPPPALGPPREPVEDGLDGVRFPPRGSPSRAPGAETTGRAAERRRAADGSAVAGKAASPKSMRNGAGVHLGGMAGRMPGGRVGSPPPKSMRA